MKITLAILASLIALNLQAVEFQTLFENEQIAFSKVMIEAGEEIGLHRDVYPQVVYALKGGIITRLEADGSQTDVHFPTGQTVLRYPDPPHELHKSVNKGSDALELMILQLKQETYIGLHFEIKE